MQNKTLVTTVIVLFLMINITNNLENIELFPQISENDGDTEGFQDTENWDHDHQFVENDGARDTFSIISQGIQDPHYFWIDQPFQTSFRLGYECWWNSTPYFAGETSDRWDLYYESNHTRILNGTFQNATTIYINLALNLTLEGFYYLQMNYSTSKHEC